MANTLNSLNNGKILAQEALAYLRKALYKLDIVTTDFSAVPARKGEAVVSRIHDKATVADFGSAATDVTSTDVPVTIDQHKQVMETFTADELNKSARQLVKERMGPQLEAVADHMAAAVAGLFTVANVPTETVEPIVDCDYGTVVALRNVMSARGVTSGNRNLIANSAVYGNLLLDTILISANNSTQNDGVINDGVLRGAAGFRSIVEYPDLPTAENLIGVAVTPAAAVLAVRPPNDPRTSGDSITYNGFIGYITEPESGITVMLNEYIDQVTLARTLRLVFLYGVAIGNGDQAERLVHTAQA